MPYPPMKPFAETLRAAGNFKIFLSLLEKAGMLDGSVREPTTIFAPNDEAFAHLPKGALIALKKEPERLRSFLLGHMVPGKLMVKEMFAPTANSSRTFKAADGSELSLIWTIGKNAPPSLRINGKARVGRLQDVIASDNLITIHEIDAVLIGDDSVMPPGTK